MIAIYYIRRKSAVFFIKLGMKLSTTCAGKHYCQVAAVHEEYD